ncbi:MAG: hypothetical protein ABIQ39_02625 [Ilumatobacteraceae bacterium]
MTAPFTFAGTVSHGTLRVEDLIPTFLDTIEALDAPLAAALRSENADVIEHLMQGLEPDEGDLGFLWETLFDTLNILAPAGYVFGAHEGDGADFGFWVDEEDTIDVAVTYTWVVTVPRVYEQVDIGEAVRGYIASVGYGLDEPVSVEVQE